MYLEALLPILFVTSVAMMSTTSTTLGDSQNYSTTVTSTMSTTHGEYRNDSAVVTSTISTTLGDPQTYSAAVTSAMSTTLGDSRNDSAAVTSSMSTTKMLTTDGGSCSMDLKLVCGTPDEKSLSVLYPGLFKPASTQTTFRKRRQSFRACGQPNDYSYTLHQLSNDRDMCCIKYRQLKALSVIRDVAGVTYDVVHLLGLGLYQYLPHTSCGKNGCSGECIQQCTPTSVLVWNWSEGFPWVKFATVYLPTHCSCQNV